MAIGRRRKEEKEAFIQADSPLVVDSNGSHRVAISIRAVNQTDTASQTSRAVKLQGRFRVRVNT